MAQPETLAFDMYSTLVDPITISEQLEGYLAEEAPRVALVWRQKQLEYTFRLTTMECYEDFERVTRKALDNALTAAGSSRRTCARMRLATASGAIWRRFFSATTISQGAVASW